MKISELLKAYTKLNEVGVRQLADEIGVSASTVSRLETGNNIDGKSMIKVMRWLFSDVTPTWKENVMTLLEDYEVDPEDMATLLNQITHDLV